MKTDANRSFALGVLLAFALFALCRVAWIAAVEIPEEAKLRKQLDALKSENQKLDQELHPWKYRQ